MVDELARRGFLRLTGAVALVGAASACTSGPTTSAGGPSASATRRTAAKVSRSAATATASPSDTATTGSPPLTGSGTPDWAALQKSLHGKLIRPGAPTYNSARKLFNPRFDGTHPQAIAECVSSADVAECVRFARQENVPLALRSGGHCYAGWSTGPGLVLDVGPIHGVKYDAATRIATVGAGTRLIDFYSGLAARGVAAPGGSCPSVGVAGLTLGGGIGVLGRAWGLTCDNISSVKIVTADGQIRTCDAKQRDPSLFWASQGGAGGTFGVVTAFTFKTHRAPSVLTWVLHWPWSQAARVVNAWQHWGPSAPDPLWSTCHLSSVPGGSSAVVTVAGTYLGTDTASLGRLIDRLVSSVGSEPSTRSVASHSFLSAMLTEAGCADESVAECHLTPAGTVQRQAYAATSDWVVKPMSGAGIATLVRAVQRRQDTRGVPDVSIAMDASGGQINRVPAAATAFVHRDALCSIQYIANWYPNTTPAAVRSASAWPHATRTSMQPYVSGQAYQNYVDPLITNWQQAYFGKNYPRLQQVKAQYDPKNLFKHPQGVTPP